MTTRCNPLSFVLAIIASSLLCATAHADDQRELNLEQQPLADALKSVANEFDLEIAFFSDTTDGIDAVPLAGNYTQDQAFDALLDDTSLEYEQLDNGTVVVRVKDERGASDSKNLTPQPVLMAQNQTTPAQTNSSRSEDEPDADQADGERDTRGQIETIVVVGSRNAGIRRYEDDIQPYVVFESSEIRDSFSTNVEDFLKTRLPMNSIQASQAQNSNNFFGNQSQIDLRGLGVDETLVLVNGRRLPSVSTTGSFRQPDINGIPMSAIERIEVLPSTAAGIYGGGATGGAINIITKQDFSGATVNLVYENTFETNAPTRKAEIYFGSDLEGGRTNLSLSGSYSTADPLTTADRDFAKRGRQLLLRNNGSAFDDGFFPPAGFRTNVRSFDGSDLVLADGTSLGSSSTVIPLGYQGYAVDGGGPLLENAGQLDLGLPNDVNGATRRLLATPTIATASLGLRREFSDSFSAILDVSYSENDAETSAAFIFGGFVLPESAPNNPFQSTVVGFHSFPDIDLPSYSKSTSINYLLTGIFDISHKWSMAVEYGTGSSELKNSNYSPSVTFDFFGARSAGDLDVMVDVNSLPLDLSPYLYEAPTEVGGPFETTLENIALRLTGSTELAGIGPIQLSSLIEHRVEEKQPAYRDITNFVSGVSSVEYFPLRSQEIDSAYLEALMPLLPDRSAQELELQLAVRYDRYTTESPTSSLPFQLSSRDDALPDIDFESNSVSSDGYTIGLKYTPIPSVRLRGSFATGFIAPSIDQISPFVYTSTNTGLFSLVDPQRGGTVGNNTLPIEVTALGNPDLGPEDSESLSLGVMFAPRWLSGLTLSIDYTEIKKNNEIARPLTERNLLLFEDRVPHRVTRLPLTPEDEALGFTAGEVVAIDVSAMNIAKAEVEAFDLQLDYVTSLERFGDIHVYLVATRQRKLERQIFDDSLAVNSVAFADGPLELRGNIGANWSWNDWTIGWNSQYFDSYKVFSSADSDALIESKVANQGSAYIDSQIYHDIFVKYAFENTSGIGKYLLGGEIRLGIMNVFDESPPILATGNAFGGYSLYGDPRLRRYALEFEARF